MGQRDTRHKIKSVEWWTAQAAKVSGGTCLKCHGRTVGQYVPATMGTVLECAVVEHCQLCGWEWIVVRGRAGEPQGTYTRPEQYIRKVGIDGVADPHTQRPSTSHVYRLAKRGTVLPQTCAFCHGPCYRSSAADAAKVKYCSAVCYHRARRRKGEDRHVVAKPDGAVADVPGEVGQAPSGKARATE